MRILLVDVDPGVTEPIKVTLRKAQFQVEDVADGVTGMQMAQSGAYALIILADNLPRRTGWEVCEALRRRRNAVPILLLTAKDSVEDRVRGLEVGADDCLPKPFDVRELHARVRALLRRDHVNKTALLRIADLSIDTAARQAWRGGREIALTRREFTLLAALARNEGRILTREIILQRVWGEETLVPETVNFHITSLRRKLDAGHTEKLIHTVYGVGYVLRNPLEAPSKSGQRP